MNKPTLQNAKELAPSHREFDPRYKIIGADYRNVFGELLWSERPYPFKKLNRPNDTFVENYVTYTVRRVAIADGIVHYNVVADG